MTTHDGKRATATAVAGLAGVLLALFVQQRCSDDDGARERDEATSSAGPAAVVPESESREPARLLVPAWQAKGRKLQDPLPDEPGEGASDPPPSSPAANESPDEAAPDDDEGPAPAAGSPAPSDGAPRGALSRDQGDEP